MNKLFVNKIIIVAYVLPRWIVWMYSSVKNRNLHWNEALGPTYEKQLMYLLDFLEELLCVLSPYAC